MGNEVTTIIFDLSEVLLRGLHGTADRLAGVLPYSPSEIDRHLTGPDFYRLMRGQLFEREYWNAMKQQHGWRIPISTAMDIVRQNFQEIEHVRPQIIDLRRRGYRLGLLSNHAREWIEHCEQRFHYEQLFDDAVYSFHRGHLKPERIMFSTALQRLSANPEQTLFVDDQPENLLAARELGMRVLQMITPHQFMTDLELALQ